MAYYNDYNWKRDQYARGVEDGSNGRRALHSNQYYQKGYRRGRDRRKHDLEKQQFVKA